MAERKQLIASLQRLFTDLLVTEETSRLKHGELLPFVVSILEETPLPMTPQDVVSLAAARDGVTLNKRSVSAALSEVQKAGRVELLAGIRRWSLVRENADEESSIGSADVVDFGRGESVRTGPVRDRSTAA